jgi:hypothetical protein
MTATFEHALKGLRSTGASLDTQALVELIARHGHEESRLLSTYEALASDSSDEGTRYLIELIVEDERRHHPERATPAMPRGLEGELLDQTRRLLAAERSDHRALRRFRRSLRPFRDTTMWTLIIDVMLLDTKKHATILQFLEHHGRRR